MGAADQAFREPSPAAVAHEAEALAVGPAAGDEALDTEDDVLRGTRAVVPLNPLGEGVAAAGAAAVVGIEHEEAAGGEEGGKGEERAGEGDRLGPRHAERTTVQVDDQREAFLSLAARRPEEGAFDGPSGAVVPGEGLDLGQGLAGQRLVEARHRPDLGQAAAGDVELRIVRGVRGDEGDGAPVARGRQVEDPAAVVEERLHLVRAGLHPQHAHVGREVVGEEQRAAGKRHELLDVTRQLRMQPDQPVRCLQAEKAPLGDALHAVPHLPRPGGEQVLARPRQALLPDVVARLAGGAALRTERQEHHLRAARGLRRRVSGGRHPGAIGRDGEGQSLIER